MRAPKFIVRWTGMLASHLPHMDGVSPKASPVHATGDPSNDFSDFVGCDLDLDVANVLERVGVVSQFSSRIGRETLGAAVDSSCPLPELQQRLEMAAAFYTRGDATDDAIAKVLVSTETPAHLLRTLRNRVSAARSRKRKKDELYALRRKVADLSAQLQRVTAENGLLRRLLDEEGSRKYA